MPKLVFLGNLSLETKELVKGALPKKIGIALVIIFGFWAYIYASSSVLEGSSTALLGLLWARWMSGKERYRPVYSPNVFYRAASAAGWISAGFLISGFLWGEIIIVKGLDVLSPAVFVGLALLGVVALLDWIKVRSK